MSKFVQITLYEIRRVISLFLSFCLFAQSTFAETKIVTRGVSTSEAIHHTADTKAINHRSQIDARIIPADSNISIDRAANGVQVVHINAPNNSGISHNRFNDFNVSESGLILNNSPREGLSQLGGMVLANPNMVGGTSANTIINEVISSNMSHIRGATEVFGRRAHYILANPNGINIGGADFINIHGVTLTTGVPSLNSRGELEKILLDKGNISFSKDLDLRDLDYFDVIARTTQINAKLHAGKEARIVSGTGSFDTKTKAFASKEVRDSKPTLSIDSYHYGGLYAGKIFIQATEKGVGVNLGKLEADTGDITIDVNGNLRHRALHSTKGNIGINSRGNVDVETSSQIEAGGDISYIAAGDIKLHGANIASHGKGGIVFDSQNLSNSGSIVSKFGQIRINSSNNFWSDGKLLSPKDVQIKALGDVYNSGIILSEEANIYASSGRDFINHGTIHTLAGQTHITGIGSFHNSGRVSSYGTLTIDILGNIHNIPDIDKKEYGLLESRDNAVIIRSADSLFLNKSLIRAPKEVAISAKEEAINQGIIRSDQVSIDSEGNITNAGKVEGSKTLKLDSGSNIINGGNLLSGGREVRIITDGNIENLGSIGVEYPIDPDHQAGLYKGSSSATLSTAALDAGSSDKSDNGYLEIRAKGDFFNKSGALATSSKVDKVVLRAFDIKNDGGIIRAPSELDIKAARDVANLGGTIKAKKIFVDSGRDLISSKEQYKQYIGPILKDAGMIASIEDMQIKVGGKITNSSEISAGGPLILETDMLDNSGGQITAGGAAKILVSNDIINKKGSFIGRGQAAIRSIVGDINNDGGLIVSKDALDLTTLGNMSIRGGQVESGDRLRIESNNLESRHSIIKSSGPLAMQIQGKLENFKRGSMESGDAIVINADSLDNDESIISSRGKSTFAIEGQISNSIRSFIESKGEVEITANSIGNSGDIVSREGSVSIAVENDLANANSGKVSAKKLLSLESRSGELKLEGLEYSEGAIALKTKKDFKNGSRIISNGGMVTISTEGKFTNSREIEAPSGFSLSALAVENLGAIKLGGAKAAITAKGQIVNLATIEGDVGTLALVTTTDVNLTDSGKILLKGRLESESNHFTNAGKLVAEKGGAINASSSFNTKTGSVINFYEGKMEIDTPLFTTEIKSNVAGKDVVINGKSKQSGLPAGSINNSGTLFAKSALEIYGNSIDNHGLVVSDGTLIGEFTGDITNRKLFFSEKSMELAGANFTNSHVINSALTAKITASSLTNNGKIEAQEGLTIDSAGYIANNGNLYSYGDMALKGASLTSNGKVGAKGQLTTSIAGNVINRATIEAGDILLKLDGELDNIGHDILSSGGVQIKSRSDGKIKKVSNQYGTISAEGGDLVLYAESLYQPADISSDFKSESDLKKLVPANPQTPVVYDGRDYVFGHIGPEWGPEISKGANRTGEVYIYMRMKNVSLEASDSLIAGNPATISAFGNVNISLDHIDSIGSNITSQKNSFVGQKYGRVINAYRHHLKQGHYITYNRWIAGSSTRTWGNRPYGWGRKDRRAGRFYVESPGLKQKYSRTQIKSLGTTYKAQNVTIKDKGFLNTSYSRPKFEAAANLGSASALSPSNISDTKAGSSSAKITMAQKELIDLAYEFKRRFSGVAETEEEDYSKYHMPDERIANTLKKMKWSKDLAPSKYYIKEVSIAHTDPRIWKNSSDYIKRIPGYDPNTAPKDVMEFGDAYHQNLFIRRQMQELTGFEDMGDFTDPSKKVIELLESGVRAAEDLKLTPGVILTKEQINKLQDDIAWVEYIDIDGDGNLKAIPRLYQAPKNARAKFLGIKAQNSAYLEGTSFGQRVEAETVIYRSPDSDMEYFGDTRASNIYFDSSGSLRFTGKASAQNTLHARASVDLEMVQGTAQAANKLIMEAGRDASYYNSDVKAGRSLITKSGNNTHMIGTDMSSDGDMEIKSAGSLAIEREVGRSSYHENHYQDKLGRESKINAGQKLTVKTGDDFHLLGSQVKSGSFNADIGGNVVIATKVLESKNHSGYGANYYRMDSVKHVKSSIESKGPVKIKTKGDLIVDGSDIGSDGDIDLHSGGKVEIASVSNYTNIDQRSESKSKRFFGSSTKTSQSSSYGEELVEAKIKSGGKFKVLSKKNQEYIGADLDAKDSIEIEGEEIAFKASKVSKSESHDSSKKGSLWQSSKGRGSSSTEIKETQVKSKEFALKSKGRIYAETISVESPLESRLKAQRPYLNSYLDINHLTPSSDSYSYKHSGLTKEGSLLVGLTSSIGTMGFLSGSNLFATELTKNAIFNAGINGAMMSGTSAFTLHASINLINNRGNVGRALTETMSKESLTSLGKSALIGGVTGGVLKSMGLNGDISDMKGGKLYSHIGQKTLVEEGISTAIEGSDPSKIAERAGQRVALASLQHKVGDIGVLKNYADGSVQKMAMHGIVGGVYSQATGDKFARGFATSAVAEKVGSIIDSGLDKGSFNATSEVTGLVSASTSMLFGGKGKSMSISSQTATSAHRYNNLLHPTLRYGAPILGDAILGTEVVASSAIGSAIIGAKETVSATIDSLESSIIQNTIEIGLGFLSQPNIDNSYITNGQVAYSTSMELGREDTHHMLMRQSSREQSPQSILAKGIQLQSKSKADIRNRGILEKKRGDYKKPKASQLKALGQATTTAPGMPDPGDNKNNSADKKVRSKKEKQLSKDARKFRLNSYNPTNRRILENIEIKAKDYINTYSRGSIRREFPGEYMDKTMREVLEDSAKRIPSAQKAKKLLIQIRFGK